MVTHNKKQENDSPQMKNQNRTAQKLAHHQNPTVGSTPFFDLHTTNGQILFLFITITISSLILLIPNENITNSIKFLIKTDAINSDTVDNKLGLCNQSQNIVRKMPTYWVYGKSSSDSHLKHVHLVLERLGFNYGGTNESVQDWDLLWAHDYPFRNLYPKLHQLSAHQKVNHFPGCGFLTNKVDLATTNLRYIPKSFKLPADREEFLAYSVENPQKLFVQKHNQHRYIYVKSVEEIDYNDNDTFIQEYVDNPLLVDGHKFDIGVYVIITSIDPLRIYIYKGDILFRYCPLKYYPFDAKLLDKYIVGDDYLPTWEIASLAQFYNGLGFGMKDSFDGYLRSKGRNPDVIWTQVEDAIRLAVLNKEHHIANILKSFKTKNNFFEMMRFDLVVDNDLNVFLMEANMSPNLSSAHFLPNRLLYEQVIYHLLNLVGVGSPLARDSLKRRPADTEAMLTSDKNIVVDSVVCSTAPCSESCAPVECQLCRPCLSQTDLADLRAAYREHIQRGDTKRIFPIPIVNRTLDTDALALLTPKNQLITKWFFGKCLMDSSWCS